MNDDLRARLVKKKYNQFMDEGTVVRGAVYLEKPGVKYLQKQREKDQKMELEKLRGVKNVLATDLRIQRSMLEVDVARGRVITSEKIVRRYKDALKRLQLVPAVVEEIPEQDFLEVVVDFV